MDVFTIPPHFLDTGLVSRWPRARLDDNDPTVAISERGQRFEAGSWYPSWPAAYGAACMKRDRAVSNLEEQAHRLRNMPIDSKEMT